MNLPIYYKNIFSKPHHLLCAHTGKEFDFPFIARRMLIHDGATFKTQFIRKKALGNSSLRHAVIMEIWRL